jgi:hypothetical protein
MKKIFMAVLAFASVASYAHNHDSKHMVRFYGFDADESGVQSFDVSFKTEDNGTTKSSSNNVSLNYAYAVTNAIQVGVTYHNNQNSDGNKNMMGGSVYYNTAGKLTDTCYFALHYNVTTDQQLSATQIAANEKEIDIFDTIIEYGHRFSIGSAWGMHLTYAPSVAYKMTKQEQEKNDEDYTTDTTSLTWNFLKFDLLF